MLISRGIPMLRQSHPKRRSVCIFLKQLKRAGVPHAQLLHFYLAVIRPVLEYAAPVWHHSLNKSQKNQTEAIQERAIRIIFSCACDMPYTSALFVAGLVDLDCHTIFSNLFHYRHLVYIVYFCHLAILNYCLALGLPPNIPEFQIELKTRGQSNLTKCASRGPIPGGRNLYHWIPGVGVPISVP